jgi:ABC-type multidrug transport system fused ATPase/permease subunit
MRNTGLILSLANDGTAPAGEDCQGRQTLSLETMITDRGGNLSVGQRQMIALGRALVRGGRVLILDEGRLFAESYELIDTFAVYSTLQLHLLSVCRLPQLSQTMLMDDIDHEMDVLIQRTLRRECKERGVTLITVAHRLRSVMDFDRIVGFLAGNVTLHVF